MENTTVHNVLRRLALEALGSGLRINSVSFDWAGGLTIDGRVDSSVITFRIDGECTSPVGEGVMKKLLYKQRTIERDPNFTHPQY